MLKKCDGHKSHQHEIHQSQLDKLNDEIGQYIMQFDELIVRYNQRREEIYKLQERINFLEDKVKPNWIENLFWITVGVGLTYAFILNLNWL